MDLPSQAIIFVFTSKFHIFETFENNGYFLSGFSEHRFARDADCNFEFFLQIADGLHGEQGLHQFILVRKLAKGLFYLFLKGFEFFLIELFRIMFLAVKFVKKSFSQRISE